MNRDEIAIRAMEALIISTDGNMTTEDIARMAYVLADRMIERSKMEPLV